MENHGADGVHYLTEDEYVARFRERQAREQTDLLGGEPPT